jgi:NAD(P)-dependent dehydrogenase (short-subunit alcohol dehydrogenase family)
MNIVITGSGKGIGAYLFDNLKKKHKIIGISRSKGKRTTLRADISNKKEVKNIFSKIPVIDVLINNASTSSADKDNLNGAFYCSFFSIPKLKKSKVKKIINISSINAHVALPDNPGYVASKGGINALSRSLAVDYGKYGIRVNSLSLGYINAGMSKKSYLNNTKRVSRSKNTILNKWGSKKDVLNTINFLIDHSSNYITGSDIVIDGGWLAKGLK